MLTTLFIIILLTLTNNAIVNAQRIMVTLAGTGVAGDNGDGGSCSQSAIHAPNDICMDVAHNIYFTDTCNHKIKKISAKNGVITTIAGGGSSIADGILATSASLTPSYMCIDSIGNLYVSSGKVRKIDAITGIITTIAGGGSSSADGVPATMANLGHIRGICIDRFGNIYVVDAGYHRIRKVIAATGIITTIAGIGRAGYSGDGGPATAAELGNCIAIGIDSSGDVFFSDQDGMRIRKISAASGVISAFAGDGGAVANANGGKRQVHQ